MSKVGDILQDRYELKKLIARGGMSEVFLAEDKDLKRQVAVKILFSSYAEDPSFVRRFQREAQAAAALNHQGVVGIYNQSNEGETYFIVMEYISGQSLATIMKEQKRIRPDIAASIAIKVSGALSFAHQNGVIHRDIKPGNILITPKGEIKVTDFGIAQAMRGTDTTLTQTGTVLGTAKYCSPEQAQGERVDARTDLYSLGVVLYEMLSGATPFKGDSAVAVAYKHAKEPPPPLPRDVPLYLRDITMKLLSKNPDDRYPDAKSLLADLRKGSSRRLARPPAPPRVSPANSRLIKRVPRSRIKLTLWATSILGAVALILGVVAIIAGNSLADENNEDSVIVLESVFDLDFSEAVRELETDGFTVTTERQTNVNIPKDKVFNQTPAAGAKLKAGDTITLFVSIGPDLKPVPRVIGYSLIDAQRVLEGDNFGYKTSVISVESDEPPGQVVDQNPAAGESASLGEIIYLSVAIGVPERPVPDVVGLFHEVAQDTLEQDGFVIQFVYIDSSLEEGFVVSTSPKANEFVRTNDIIVRVSTGNEEVLIMPNVVGFFEAVARSELVPLGVVLEVVKQPAQEGQTAGEVVDQSPSSGTVITQNQTVTIVIAE